MASDSGSSPWLYRAAAVGATVALVGGAGYILYKYVICDVSDQDDADKPTTSMQALLTGGAAGGSSSTGRNAAKPALPVRRTPSPARARTGPNLPARRAPAPASRLSATTAPSASEAAAAPSNSGDPAGPSTSTPSASAAPSTPTASGSKPAAANLRACACCSQPLPSGLPQRCTQCKTAYYCSRDCQKRHWPEHKLTCKPAASVAAGAAETSTGESESAADAKPASEGGAPQEAGGEAASDAAAAAAASSSTSGAEAAAEDKAKEGEAGSAEPSAAADGAAEGSAEPSAAAADGAAGASGSGAAGASSGDSSGSGSGSGAAGGSHGGGLQGALVEVLRQAAERGAGTLDGAFEEAVMHFLGGKLPTALAAFESLQSSARSQGRDDLVLELYKWLGHTNTKLGNFTAAAEAFQAGIDKAKEAGNTLAQVDNAVGLGNLWKMAGKLTQAAEVLKTALVVAQEAGSDGMQSEVLVALGNVVMSVDAEEGLACLQIAVKLREDEVAKAAETGDRAAMATGMMQAAAAMVNMGAALFATRRFEQSKQAYEQAMEIFELMEDNDKVIQVLINLANLAELQLDLPAEALEYREKLAEMLKAAGHPGLAGGASTPPCGVCKKPISLFKARPASDPGAAMVLLGCLHVQHDSCFKDWSDTTQVCPEAVGEGLAAAAEGGEAAATLAATAASPGAKRMTVCPTCKAPVPVM